MREHNKRWLVSMMKTSGSKRRHLFGNDRYADGRSVDKQKPADELPQRESIKSTDKFYNGKINYGLLLRFLRNKAGHNWNEVYAEVIARIPTKLMYCKEMIFWFVADKVEIVDGTVRNLKTQKPIWTGGTYEFSKEKFQFYVHPETNILIKINDIPRKDNATKRK